MTLNHPRAGNSAAGRKTVPAGQAFLEAHECLRPGRHLGPAFLDDILQARPLFRSARGEQDRRGIHRLPAELMEPGLDECDQAGSRGADRRFDAAKKP